MSVKGRGCPTHLLKAGSLIDQGEAVVILDGWMDIYVFTLLGFSKLSTKGFLRN